MDTRLTKNAVKKLELRDIVLHSSSFSRNKDYEPLLYPLAIKKENGLQVKTEEICFLDDENNEVPLLRIYVNLETRGIGSYPSDEMEDKEIELFKIDAIYRIDYLIKKHLSDEEIKEFSKFNAVHNTWPFWRQHVYSVTNNARLPQIVITFFFAAPDSRKKKRTKRHRVSKKKPV